MQPISGVTGGKAAETGYNQPVNLVRRVCLLKEVPIKQV
jgi:hypothetical protein